MIKSFGKFLHEVLKFTVSLIVLPFIIIFLMFYKPYKYIQNKRLKNFIEYH